MKSTILALVFLITMVSRFAWSADPIDALALYPLEIRQAILVALKYPRVLVGLDEMQRRSSGEFRQWVNSLPAEQKKQALKLAPFPNMVHALNLSGTKNPAGVETVLKNFPKDLEAPARDLMTKHPEVLNRLDQLDDKPYQEYENLMQNLPQEGRWAFHKLLRYPDTLQNLSLALNLSSTGSAAYQKNPSALDSRAQTVTAQLQKAANPPPPKFTAAPGDDPAALASLQKQADSMNRELSEETNVNPNPPGAAQATVSYNPYPFYNPYLGQWALPYWFGF